MFAINLGPIANVRARPDIKRSDVPPCTLLTFPPVLPTSPPTEATRTNLVHQLQTIYRPHDINATLFSNIGLQTKHDVPAEEIIPDPSFLPPFKQWDKLSRDEARELDKSLRRRLPSGHFTPGALTYLERKDELSYKNSVAFRTIRRLPPPPGTPQPRLGNCYDFFRHLETFTGYWEDTTEEPKSAEAKAEQEKKEEEKPKTDVKPGEQPLKHPNLATSEEDYFRTQQGSDMPNEYRHNLVNAFVKLIAYDFGGNTTMPRTEPRLHMCSQSPLGSNTPWRRSYVSSSCTWIFRTPIDRIAARASVVEGPIAAVSARGTTEFDTELEVCQDLSRELIAILVAAQHRDRDGKTEHRIGQDAWWTTKPRWGGGPGGPIGREVDPNAIPGDKEAALDKAKADMPPVVAPPTGLSSRFSRPGFPPVKRVKKTLSIYDNYRMIRAPSSTWDPKTKYQAIGRIHGAGYDDIFLISGLFHHISIVRVRVPLSLLSLLEGNTDDSVDYDKLVFLRSKWFDMFKLEDRLEALRIVWGMMAYQIRESLQDVQMSGTA